tara:strand:+ start:28597 stop:29277 length:681 start_codon:yes stop_codon:yes gene_type:complete
MTTGNLIPGKTYFANIKQKTFGTGFLDDACKEFYLLRLLNCQNAFHVQLHAYLLMEKQIFLLLTPLTPKGLSSYCRFLNRSYSRYYKVRFSRVAQVWKDAPTVCLLPSDNLILDCQKFVERYVLGFNNTRHPGEYRYSSYCANAFTHKPRYLKQQRAVRCFVENDSNGLERYREFIATPFREEYERFLHSRLLSGRPLLRQKLAFGLESNSSLTDIEKSGTIATIT